MRYPPGHKEKTRLAIIKAAAKVFREQGYHGAGVDAIMAGAGLTAGGFYNHFQNKEALLVAMIEVWPEITRQSLPEDIEGLEGTPWVKAMTFWYLSTENRDQPETCCPVPCIISEVGRQSDATHEAFAKSHLGWEDALVENLFEFPKEERRGIAQKIMMLSMGAITTARAMGTTPESDQYLASAKVMVEEILEGAAVVK